MTEARRVRVQRDGAVAQVELARPEKRNGLDLAMFEQLLEVGEGLLDDLSLRAVVLSGEGRAFCAGLDFASFMANPETGPTLLHRDPGALTNLAQRVAWIWREIPVPVICAVHGQAFGGGLQLALGADIRFVRPDAELSVMEIRWGLIPDMTISKSLTTLVGLDVAKELTFTGRVFGGDEAVRLGVCTRLSNDPHLEALETAHTIAQKSPHAIRAAKRMFETVVTGDATEAFALETALQVPLLGSANQMEAVQANLQKRPPEFRDPDDE